MVVHFGPSTHRLYCLPFWFPTPFPIPPCPHTTTEQLHRTYCHQWNWLVRCLQCKQMPNGHFVWFAKSHKKFISTIFTTPHPIFCNLVKINRKPDSRRLSSFRPRYCHSMSLCEVNRSPARPGWDPVGKPKPRLYARPQLPLTPAPAINSIIPLIPMRSWLMWIKSRLGGSDSGTRGGRVVWSAITFAAFPFRK